MNEIFSNGMYIGIVEEKDEHHLHLGKSVKTLYLLLVKREVIVISRYMIIYILYW